MRCFRTGAQRGPVDARGNRVGVAAVVLDPVIDRLVRDLGVELDAPPRRHGEPERLHAGRAARQHLSSRRWRGLVAVPLKGLETGRQRREQRIAAGGGLQLHPSPADLGRAHPRHLPPRGLGQQLRAEAHPEGRCARRQQASEMRLLVRQPRELGLLLAVHRPAEDEHGVGVGRRRRRRPQRRDPLDHLLAALVQQRSEDTAAGGVFVDDRQDAHGPQFHKRRRPWPRIGSAGGVSG